MRKVTLLSVFSLISFGLFSQNEFYNNGALIYINGQVGTVGTYSGTDAPTLYIKGNLVNAAGTMQNAAGEVQVTGNVSNTGTYTTTGDEVLIGTGTQRVSGNFTGANDFNNLLIQKPASAVVELAANIEVGNELEWTGAGTLRTDTVGHGSDGSLYSFEVYVTNSATASMSGYNYPFGTDKYVEGKLRRQVNGSGSYDFPVGVSSAFLDGEESFNLNFASTINTGILGYFQPATTGLGFPYAYFDIGTDPAPGVNPFSDCIGGPDGTADRVAPDLAMTHEWNINPNVTGAYTYQLTVNPGPMADISPYVTPAACGSLEIIYLGKNGALGGDGISTGSPAPWVGTGYVTAPTGNSISGQSSFSVFRMFGASDPNTQLPVELIGLQADPIDNSFIRVSWSTASEINNDGFEVLRSEDGVNFEKIGWVNGVGNSTVKNDYQLDDHNVVPNRLYYYRLNQIDNDGKESLTYIVTASITAGGMFAVSDFFPNPAIDQSSLVITSSYEDEAMVTTYDNLGQVVETNQLHIYPGSTKINVKTDLLSQGQYHTVITTSHGSETRNLIVSHP